jgi:outer membrane protein OmpA-like peptidoglycan-associated protein
MKSPSATRLLFPRALLLASALSLPAFAQQAPPASVAPPAAQPVADAAREGFWGRVNPFARKKWVNQRVDPLHDRLSELDQLNAKNANDIKDVDGRAQSGIQQAQSTADAASLAAAAAHDQAGKAGATAQSASGRVDQLGATLGGLDQYRQVGAAEIAFRGSQSLLSAEARKQLDDLAASLSGHQGYLVEIEARAPGAASLGIQNSQRLAETVKRYLVTEHQIPVYRLHSVGLGNAPAPGQDQSPTRKSGSVQIRLMENSLAASK